MFMTQFWQIIQKNDKVKGLPQIVIFWKFQNEQTSIYAVFTERNFLSFFGTINLQLWQVPTIKTLDCSLSIEAGKQTFMTQLALIGLNFKTTSFVWKAAMCIGLTHFKIRKRAKIRNRYNQAPPLNKDTNRKVTTSQLDITNESQEVSPFPAGDHKASTNRRAWKHNKTRQK